MRELGAELKRARVLSGLTQLQVSRKLNYESPMFVSIFERGISPVPVEILPKLAKIYSFEPSYLYRAYRDAKLAEVETKLNEAFKLKKSYT